MELPHHFGKYVLIKKIANGGMAEIFKAKYYGERGFAKDIAIKKILPIWSDRKDFETMLVDEAKALVHLQHQNIVQIFELGKDEGFFYISMEYVDGPDLKRLYKKTEKDSSSVPEKFACFIMMEVLKGLEFAHRQRDENDNYLNIVHRDISPQNILLSYNGEVKLADFGIAKGLHRNKETTTAQLKGKYAFMSPEQALGKAIDHRSDLYSVGIVLYELLTGTRLFATDSDFETIERVRESKLPIGWEGLVTLNMRLILKKALAKDPSERYQSAADFLRDLDRYVTFKRLNTHSLEFSDYLHRIFADEQEKEIVCDEPKKNKTQVFTKKPDSKIGKYALAVKERYAAVFLIMFSFLFLGAIRPRDVYDYKLDKTDKKAEAVPIVSVEPKEENEVVVPKITSIEEGIINIDSNPSGVAGRLEYGSFVKNFTTPFIASGIKFSEDQKGKIILAKDGFKPILDAFTLNKDRPIFSQVYELQSNLPAKLSIQARPWGYVYIPGVVSRRESPVHNVRLKPGRYKIKVHYAPTNSWAVASVSVISGKSHKCFADFTNGKKITCR